MTRQLQTSCAQNQRYDRDLPLPSQLTCTNMPLEMTRPLNMAARDRRLRARRRRAPRVAAPRVEVPRGAPGNRRRLEIGLFAALCLLPLLLAVLVPLFAA